MSWTTDQIAEFAATSSGGRAEGLPEGPAVLGRYMIWRCWTCDGSDCRAHYVIAEDGAERLLFKRDFPPFASWLMHAFDAASARGRSLDWFRSGIAAVMLMTLLWLLVWAVTGKLAARVDYRWLVAAIATIAFGYLLGGTTGRRA